MFLLFDRVYVKYDFMMDNNVDNLIITPNLQPVFLQALVMVQSAIGEQIHNVDTYEDLPYDNDLAFFEALLAKGKLNIHVNNIAYDKIFSKFLNIFFPNITRDVAWKTYNIFRTNSQLLNTTSFVWGTSSGDTVQRANAAQWVPRTRDEFLITYDATSRDLPDEDYETFVASAKQKIGIEFMIASRLAGNEDYDVFLGEKMYKLMSNRINEEALFLKSTLFNNLFRPWAQSILGISNLDLSEDLMNLEDTNAKTRWLFDDDEKYSKVEYQAKHPTIKFSEIRTAMMEAVTQSVTPIEEALTNEMMDFVHDNVDVANFTTANITTILNSDISHQGPSVFECEDRIKVNALFLSYIYKLSIDNNSELGSFSL